MVRKAAEQGFAQSYDSLAKLICKNLTSPNGFKKQTIFETSQWIINRTSQLLKAVPIPDQKSQSLRQARAHALMALNAAYSQGWKEDDFKVEKNDLKALECAFEASLCNVDNNNIPKILNYFKNRDFYVLPTADISVDLMDLIENLTALDSDYIENINYGREQHNMNDPTEVQPNKAEKPHFKLVSYFDQRYKFLHEAVSPLIDALGTINKLKSHPYLIKIDNIKHELRAILSSSENKVTWIKTYNNRQYFSFGENEVKNARAFFENLEKFDEQLEDFQKTLKTLYKIEKEYLKANQLKLRDMAELNPNSINQDQIKEECEKCNRSERIKSNLKAAQKIFKNWPSTRDEILNFNHKKFLETNPWWKMNLKINK